MTPDHDIGRAIRRELRTPVLGGLAILLFGGTAVLLLLFWFTDARGVLTPFVGPGTGLVLTAFTVAVARRARRRLRAEERDS
ncbi:hypothetical protein [Rathayibacter sp. VKM Ac-2801]|uniref:hypothetical protein n=1 Tax=Rathayibacter sp. VKM Ac-2801 TaxID=2609255 RepID=UPI00131F67FD|nr:hypothetical protein [Rathayibacter sp. VKM Ac-2801]QHC69800.1 hypothetical protein GSU45_05025 [Rathayibacter sp. VKM Ac-2801]